MNKTNKQQKNKQLTIYDINKVFIRSNLLQGSWNFERMQALGFCFSIIPVIYKIYPENNKNRKEAIKRHLEFFNTHPYLVSPILGIVIAEEEKEIILNLPISSINNNIRNIKLSLMGPLAGAGDLIFWGILRPVLSASNASISINGNYLGPILFFLSFNSIRLFIKYYGLIYGYYQSIDLKNFLNQKLIKKITEGSTILGLFTIGGLINKWNYIDISTDFFLKNQNHFLIKMQSILDQIIPGLIPLTLTLFCSWLLSKRVNPYLILLCSSIIAIISYSTRFIK